MNLSENQLYRNEVSTNVKVSVPILQAVNL